jgi:hypothetical protein
VIINLALLWLLVPSPCNWQKDCHQTWDALVRDDYVFWREADNGKAAPRDVTDVEVRALIAERTSPANQAAHKALNAVPAEPERPKKRAAEKTIAAGKRGRKAQEDVAQMGMDLGEK